MSTASEKVTETSHEDQKLVKQDETERNEAAGADQQEVETRLIDYLQNLFELENLRQNTYLINRLSRNLELYPTVIYSERNIVNICQDTSVIDAALAKVKGIEYQTGSAIKLKISSPRRTVIVKNISRIEEQQFKTFIDTLCAEQNVECQSSYDARTDTYSLTLVDEASAVQIFGLLLSKKFNQKSVDCILKEDNLYLELIEGNQNKKSQYQFPSYPTGQFPYASGYGYSSQPMPMYYMQYPSQILGQNYIRKSKESYRPSHHDTNGYSGTNSTYESSEQSPSGSPHKRGYGQYRDYGNYYGQRNGSGYRSNKTYYQKKDYENGPRGEEEETNDQFEENGGEYRNHHYRAGGRDRQDHRYGYQKGGFKDQGHNKYQRNYKKGPSEAEIEKVTKVDLDNYPPLA